MDKELIDLLVAHGVCSTQKEAESRVDKMSVATKIDMLKVLRDKSKYSLLNDSLEESKTSLSRIDLDWSGEIEEAKHLASKFNLIVSVLRHHGPAGNNPVLRFKGLKQDIIDFLRDVNYAHDSEELESIIAEIVNEKLLKEYLDKFTVGQLRTRLEDALEKLEDHDDDEEVKFASNTYWVGPHFISIPSLGFIDLENIFGDEEDLDEERITEVAGGESNGMTIEDIAKKHGVTPEEIESQLKIGIEIEQEHTSDLEAAKKIAMDHLVEFADYYDRLVKMEKEAESEIDNITDVTDESEPLKEEYYYNDKQENDFQLLVSDIWSKYSNTYRTKICDLVYNIKRDLGLKETDADRDKLRKIVEQSLVDGSYDDYLDTGSLSYLKEINESEEKLIKYAIDMIHWEPVTYLPEWAQIVDDNEYPIIVEAPENASLEDIKDELVKLGSHENVNADIEGDFEFDYEDIDYRVADESETNIEESLTESADNLVKELKNNKLFKDFADTEISKVIRIYAKDSGVKVIDIKAEDVVNFIEDIGGWGAFVLEFLTLDKSGITQEMVVKMVKKDPKLLKLVKKFADENHLLDEVERGDGIEKTDDNYIITALSFNLGGKKSTIKKDREYTIKELNKEYIALKEDFGDDDLFTNSSDDDDLADFQNNMRDDELGEEDEEIINDDSIQVYQFPNSVEEYLAEFKELCFNHNLKFLGKGKNVIDDVEEPDFFVEGRYADLTAMAEDMDYELHPDYLCPAESFAREDILIEAEEEIETHNEENIVDESFDSGLSFEKMFWGIYDGEFDLPFEETVGYINNNYAEKIWVNEEDSADLSVLTEIEKKDIIKHAKEEAQNWSNLDIYNSHARYKGIPNVKKQIKELFGVTNKVLHEELKTNEGRVGLDDEGNFYEEPDLNEFAFIIWSDEYDNKDFDKIKKFLDENDITTNFDDKNLIVIPENKEESDKISAFLDTIYGDLPEDDSSVDTL